LTVGKEVCVVGPASYLSESKAGDDINKFDVVIRTNDCFKIPPEYWDAYGSRCDVLYLNNAWIRRNILRNKNKTNIRDTIRHIVHINKTKLIVVKGKGAKAVIERTLKTITPQESGNIKVATSAHNWRAQKQFWMKGFSDPIPYYEPMLLSYILSDLLLTTPKSIFVTGCDFYAKAQCWVSFYNKTLDKGKEGIMRKKTHSVIGDMEYVKHLQDQYNVSVDVELKKILNP